jgi:NADH:ubiquinone oxidoreductase subunit 6 (subunit J)
MKITFPTFLFTVFLVLKLTKVIAWSWWWVTAPLWVTLVLIVIYAIGVAVKEAVETPEQRAARRLRELANALQKRS